MSHRPVDPDRIALAVQQPWADLIVRGIKSVEVRSTTVRLRGVIYIYASRRLSPHPAALRAAERAGLRIDDLPLGAIVGTAELVECRLTCATDVIAACVPRDHLTGKIAWRFARPERFPHPLPTRFLPCGIWFYPFRPR